jgi:hypothetical protein
LNGSPTNRSSTTRPPATTSAPGRPTSTRSRHDRQLPASTRPRSGVATSETLRGGVRRSVDDPRADALIAGAIARIQSAFTGPREPPPRRSRPCDAQRVGRVGPTLIAWKEAPRRPLATVRICRRPLVDHDEAGCWIVHDAVARGAARRAARCRSDTRGRPSRRTAPRAPAGTIGCGLPVQLACRSAGRTPSPSTMSTRSCRLAAVAAVAGRRGSQRMSDP